jgi:hypothetical protein
MTIYNKGEIDMDFVDFNLAKKLKEKGFPQHITEDAYIIDNYGEDEYIIGDRLPIPLIPDYMDDVAAPTIAQVLKWSREAKRIDAGAVWDNRDGKWIGYINEMDMPDLAGEYVLPNTYYSYEKAAIAVIEYVLDNLI